MMLLWMFFLSLYQANAFNLCYRARKRMIHLNNNKKNNTIVTTAKVLFLVTTIIFVVAGTAVVIKAPLSVQSADAIINQISPFGRTEPKAPAVISGENIYLAWWINNTENGNEEVMFRASNDAGATFSDKINLSNSSEADSWRVEIAGEGDNVVVTWWETNQTSDTPVARVSNDGGETFGPLLLLAANGTLGSGEAEEVP
jgi:hypothetical protein